jgi:hypothetical protein
MAHVNLSSFDCAPGRPDLFGHPIELFKSAAGKEQLRSLTGEGTGDGAPDRASRSVDYSVLILK